MFQYKKLRDAAKQYYQGKNMTPRIIIGVLGLIILLLILIPGGGRRPSVKTATTPTHISFAGESIPLDGKYYYNQEMLDREIAITQLNPAQFAMIHKREKLYFPYIEDALDDANLPDDLKYLVVAESALRNVAYSHAGAAGLWQFMPATARRYGLRVDDLIDERLDWQKSTQAAIAYFHDLYDIFGDWALSAAAYNGGENGLQRDQAWQYASDYYDLRLNEETARYVFRIAAIKEIMQNRQNYFDSSVLGDQYSWPATETITIQGPVADLARWAVDEGYTYRQIRESNPWILSNQLPEGEWEIEIVE